MRALISSETCWPYFKVCIRFLKLLRLKRKVLVDISSVLFLHLTCIYVNRLLLYNTIPPQGPPLSRKANCCVYTSIQHLGFNLLCFVDSSPSCLQRLLFIVLTYARSILQMCDFETIRTYWPEKFRFVLSIKFELMYQRILRALSCCQC